MAQKSQGYIHLFWDCPNCKARNQGKDSVCVQCGSPQPDQVNFYQVDNTQRIENEEEIKRAAMGADRICPYCGTRNPADHQECSQCGADISDGARRKSGQVLGAFQPGEKRTLACPHCGAENAVTRTNCHQCGAGLAQPPTPHKAEVSPPVEKPAASTRKMNPLLLVLLALGGIGLCVLLIWGVAGLFSKEEVQGNVQSVHWQYTVAVDRYGLVNREDWQENIPSDASILSCESRFHHEQEDYAPGAQEVCGTPYTIDKGNGYAEVVQDCVYRVSAPYCSYQTMDWAYDTSYTSSGNDLSVYWPAYTLASDQRVAEQTEDYQVIFTSGANTYDYRPETYADFSVCQPGSLWNLTVNGFDAVLSISPAN